VEACRAAELRAARHGYTRGLLESLPRIDERRSRLQVLTRDPDWRDGPAIGTEPAGSGTA
jgi:peptide/nickel transport system ATP-binding protein